MAFQRKVPAAPAALPRAVERAYSRYLTLALALPLAVASTSYRTPAIKVRGKLLSRWRTEAEGALAIRCDFLDREILIETQPAVFFVTDHYVGYPMVLVRLERASRAQLVDILERAWRRVAPVNAIRLRESTAEAVKQPRVTQGSQRPRRDATR